MIPMIKLAHGHPEHRNAASLRAMARIRVENPRIS
jgi:hypothetical protein